ncbi:hypothetical protein J5N97_015616 [Dioscorea zingiberensis]|uniref:Uncharacterized protein n=1 Tax=Dioscorea zingiberensis TaxID=325984 RepID=A0A9D5HEF7_9LILI|nr:hypothetical protein J5N97_015616 [Dioscorea zingiberensis]
MSGAPSILGSLCGRMISIQSWKCSWSLVATVGSLVVLVSLVHMFMWPLFPSSLDYYGARQEHISCSAVNGTGHNVSELLNGSSWSAIDFNVQFPADSHGAVAYRGAPWKPDIGKWFSGCGSVSAAIDAVELREEFRALDNSYKLVLNPLMSSIVYWLEIDEDALEQALSADVTSTILAAAGPQRSRVLATLYKVYLERILRKPEIDAFAEELKAHQKALLPDNVTVLDRAMIEHKVEAVIHFEDDTEELQLWDQQVSSYIAEYVKPT